MFKKSACTKKQFLSTVAVYHTMYACVEISVFYSKKYYFPASFSLPSPSLVLQITI